MLAQEEARRLGHNFVGTEQILLGLIGESTGRLLKTVWMVLRTRFVSAHTNGCFLFFISEGGCRCGEASANFMAFSVGLSVLFV